ncbi:unnamed protein product [Linum tenue]|uniref:Aminotransferase-like plant mobile domain-containing protein n=1 Tax=Linum tenue TaxID=586396 RepID=A0AAV0LIB0_9ROSI|nr:unnamed protein product [Linum tenue]
MDKRSDRVRSVVNLFLDKLEEVDHYSWASGTLAWLYRQLGQASRAGARRWLVVSHFCSVGSTSTGCLRDTPPGDFLVVLMFEPFMICTICV